MRRLIGRIWLGLVLTAATLAAAATVPRLVGASSAPWPKLAVVGLLGESTLLVMAARRGAPPPEPIDAPGERLPDPITINRRWLWTAVPTAVVGVALFLILLLA